ncbi:MAG: hypothetical protein AAF600_12190 [Bacteroidota bacterium]
MKDLLAIILIFVVLYHLSRKNLVSTYVDKIRKISKTGISGEVINNDKMEYGNLDKEAKTLKSAIATEIQKVKLSHKYECFFCGIYFAYLVFHRKKRRVKFNAKTGVTNQESFVIISSLPGKSKPGKFIGVERGWCKVISSGESDKNLSESLK